ncbi:MAG TPA: hypothetical protein VK034_07870, partial [Enhygromyxa sp.]|nr:hypothetical protein [Enhygromyxa sp.]
MRRAIPAVLLCLAAGACSGDPTAEATEQGDDDPDEDEGEGEGETGEPPPASGDRCEDTALIIEAPSTLVATLRNANPDKPGIAAACGLTGPVVFVEAKLHGRADLLVSARGRAYTPKFAVLLPGCIADPGRILACGETLPVTIRDIGPEVDLLLAIGVDQADPALELPRPKAEALDPLDFELRLEARAVLAEHQQCGPAFGRCEAGTVCLARDEDGGAIDRCRRPPADSCALPGALAVPSPGAAAVIEIASDEPHSDAHEHACTGWRRPERVERLELPVGLGEAAILRVEADDPRVGLALRGPDCLPESALACAPALGSGEAISLSFGGAGQLAALAAADQAPILFIELPREDDADPPATIHV